MSGCYCLPYVSNPAVARLQAISMPLLKDFLPLFTTWIQFVLMPGMGMQAHAMAQAYTPAGLLTAP